MYVGSVAWISVTRRIATSKHTQKCSCVPSRFSRDMSIVWDNSGNCEIFRNKDHDVLVTSMWKEDGGLRWGINRRPLVGYSYRWHPPVCKADSNAYFIIQAKCNFVGYKAPERQRQEGENKESNIVSDSPIRVYTATMHGQEDQKRLNQGGTAQSSVLRYIKNLRFLSKSFQLLARPQTPLWKLFEQLPFFPKAQLQSRLDVVSDWLKYWFLPQGHVAQPSIRRS